MSAVARLWTRKIINGECNFWEVKDIYKYDIRALLIKAGREDLIIEQKPTEEVTEDGE